MLEHRSVPAVRSIAVHADVERDELPDLVAGRDRRTAGRGADQQALDVAGPPGGLYGFDVFANDRGPATVFIPVDGPQSRPPAA